MKRKTLLLPLLLLAALPGKAQMYTGLSGLLHTPSADMLPEGTARIGGYYMNSHLTPDARNRFAYNKEKYNTADFYLSIAPFRWVEIGYTFTLLKTLAPGHDRAQYNNKDRYFSLKLQPLREGKYWPAVVIGSNDFVGSPAKGKMVNNKSNHFMNYYVAATKHFDMHGHDLSLNVAYRYWPDSANSRKWQGVVGGVTWRPSFAPDLRVIAEYTGHELNFGADYLLLRHLLLQAQLQSGRYPSAGLCFQTNLLGRTPGKKKEKYSSTF